MLVTPFVLLVCRGQLLRGKWQQGYLSCPLYGMRENSLVCRASSRCSARQDLTSVRDVLSQLSRILVIHRVDFLNAECTDFSSSPPVPSCWFASHVFENLLRGERVFAKSVTRMISPRRLAKPCYSSANGSSSPSPSVSSLASTLPSSSATFSASAAAGASTRSFGLSSDLRF